MKAFLKSLDTYNRDLKLSTHNSETRGCFNLILIISFLIFNITYIVININQPKLKRIEEMNYINTELLNIKGMEYNMSIKITEYYSNYGEDLHLCDLYFTDVNNNKCSIKSIIKDDTTSVLIRHSEALISFLINNIFSKIKEISIKKECQKDADNQILDSSIKTYVNFDYINDGMLINRLNFNEDNSKKFIYKQSSYDAMIDNTASASEYSYKNLSVKITLNSIYNDYKGIFDFNSEVSSGLKCKLKNKEKIGINIDKQDYLFSTSDIKRNYIKDNKNDYLLILDFDLNHMSTIYIRNYYHFLYYIPMFFSIFISIMKGFSIFNLIISYNYRYFYFLNNNCNIGYNIRQHLNSINDYTNTSNVANNSQNIKSNNNKVNDYNYNESNNITVNQNNSISRCLDISNSSYSNNKLLFDGEVSKDNSNYKDEDSDKNKIYILENNDLKYTKKDAFLFFIPFKCCRSDKTNIKLEILRDLKHKLNYDKSSFCYLTNSVTTYLLHKI